MPGPSAYMQWLRSRYLRIRSILTGNSKRSSNAIPFFHPSYIPYQGSSLKPHPPSMRSQQASNRPVKEDVPFKEQQRAEGKGSGISDLLRVPAVQILLPRMPQYARLPPPASDIDGQAVQILLPKMSQFKRLPPPESNVSGQKTHRREEDNKVRPLAASHLQASDQPAQGGSKRKGNDISGPTITTQAARILLPTMPQDQRFPLPGSNTSDHKTHRHEKDNKVFSLAASHLQTSDRPVQEGSERKGNDISGPTLTTQAARIPLPTTPQDQRLLSPESEEYAKAVAVSKEMDAIRALCAKYHKENIYNMDETILSWRHVLYAALAPESTKDISQMTLVLCVNSDGSDRLPVWVITTEKKPVSLDGLDPRAFGAAWQSSKKLSMTAEAMQEWLLQFYSHIGSQRSIILLLDNLSAHQKGVRLAPPPSNIRIQWLPPGTTSRYQPLDQGINRALRDHYRLIWIEHMFRKLYGGEFMNPAHTISSELAVHWIVQIWKLRIANKTIDECFRKSSILRPQPPSPRTQNLPGPTALQSGYVDLSEYTGSKT